MIFTIKFPEVFIHFINFLIAQTANIMLLMHNFYEYPMGNQKILMAFDYFAHLFVVLALFFRRTFSRTNVTVIPVKRVQCLNFIPNHSIKLFCTLLLCPDRFVQSFSGATKLPAPAKQSVAPP